MLKLKIATLAEKEIFTLIPMNNIEDVSEKRDKYDYTLNSHVISKRDSGEKDYDLGRDFVEIRDGNKEMYFILMTNFKLSIFN